MMTIECVFNQPTVSKLEIDVDLTSSRIMIQDRFSYAVLMRSKVKPIVKVVLPAIYASQNNLCVIMYDDTRAFNAVTVDGVKAELFDSNIPL